jgi:hypothetical protein
MPSSPYRLPGRVPPRRLGSPCSDGDLIPVFSVAWLACAARVVAGAVQRETFGAEPTMALLLVLILPILGSDLFRVRGEG